MFVSITGLVPHVADAESVSEAKARIRAVLVALEADDVILGTHTIAVLRGLTDQAFAFLEGRRP